MIHQPLGGAQGGQTDIDIQVISSFLVLGGWYPYNEMDIAFYRC